MKQCLGKHAERRFGLFNFLLLILILFMPLYLLVAEAFAVPPAAPIPINVADTLNGTANLTWSNVPPSANPGSTITYRVYRDLVSAGISTIIINNTTGLNFTDTVAPFDGGQAGDSAKDGTTWDAGNNRYGQTYKYTVFAVDSFDSLTNWNNTTAATIEVKVHWCDARSPNANALTMGPADGSFKPPANHEVRVNFDYLDWTLGTPAAAVIQLNYSINGAAQAPLNMALQGAQNPSGVTTLRATMNLTTAADGAEIKYWVSGRDSVGNLLQSTAAPKTLLNGDEITFRIDAGAPTITGINYMETGANPGIDQNDQIIVTFNEQIQTGQVGQTALSANTFQLGRVAGGVFAQDPAGNFGTGATVTPGPLNTQVTIILGANPVIKFVAPPGDNLINSIRYSPLAANAIRDLAANSANSVQGYEIVSRLTNPASIELPNAPRPFINANPIFTDTNNSGTVNAGDKIVLVFSKPLILNNTNVAGADFSLPVTNDTIAGTGTLVAGTNNQIDFSIQAGSAFTIAGVYNPANTGAGSPSGIDVVLAGPNIVDEFGNRAQQVPGGSGGPNRDIAGASTQGPRLITAATAAEYTDIPDANGIMDGLSANDTMTLTFDKPIIFGAAAFTAANAFRLPVTNDNLDNPTFAINPANNTQMTMTFNGPANITVAGVYSGNTAQGAPSGVDIINTLPDNSIMDIYGNKAASQGTPRDIGSTDSVGPAISTIGDTVLYTDNAPTGVSQGDFIDIEFNKPIVLSAVTQAAFQLSNLTLGTGATFTAAVPGVNNRKLRITLGTAPAVTFSGANRSQIDVNNGTIQIQNWKGTGAVATSLRNVVSASTIGPKISTAVYTDVDNNGVTVNDTILITFDKPIQFTAANVTAADFQLQPGGGNLGGAGFAANNTGLNTNQIKLILGAAPSLVIAGTFGIDAAATGIDIKAPNTANIQDQMGNPAEASTMVDIGGSDTTRPTLLTAVFTDTAAPPDGITAGDELTLTFNKAVTALATITGAAFQLPVAGDSLATFTLVDPATAVPPLLPTQIKLRFTTAPTIKVAGLYNGNIAPGSSSGIDISSTITTGVITDVYGNTAANSTVKDIGSSDTSNPTPVAARYTDVGNNGVTAGDIIELDFSKPILVNPFNTTPVTAAHFTVTNGNLGGAGLTFEKLNNNANNITIKITLGTGAALQFNPPAAANSTINVNDGGGPIQSITDISGNGAVHSTPAVNITAGASAGPTIVAAVYTDVTKDGITAGDFIVLTFNKNITANNPTIVNFSVPANNGADTLGTGAAFTQTGVNANQLKVTLGTNPSLKIIGVYSGPTGTSSGINISAPNAATIIDNLNQPAVPAADAVDITGVVESGPQITVARWADLDNSGTVSAGDTLSITFNKAIVVPLPPPPPATALVRTVFNLPVSGDYFDFTTYAKTGVYELTFTLSGQARFIVPGVYNGNNGAGQPSGIDIAAGGIPANSITDVSGNLAIPSVSITDIQPGDSTGPTLITAVYNDFNNSNTVDAGDRVTVTFSKPVTLNNPIRTNFNVQNGNLGNNPTFSAGPLNTQLLITLDAGTALTFFGASTSSIDLVGPVTTIVDGSGNQATSSTQKFITVQTGGQGPLVTSCVWIDNAPLGVVSAGDTLRVGFDKNVIIRNPPSANDFVLPVAGDSLGTGVNVAAGANAKEILITLGAGAYLTIAGVYNGSAVNALSPSGIDISPAGAAAGNITDTFGFNARQNTPVGIDITSADTTGPRIITILYEDVDTNGVTINDKLYLTFDKNVTSSVWVNKVLTGVTAANFSMLPAGTANLGTNPIFEWYDTTPNQIIVKLGNNPLITVKGVYPTDAGATGMDVSGTLSNITDISGNGARPNVPAGVDIGPIETTGPHVVGCRYSDSNNSKVVDQGDFLFVVFSKPIVITNPVVADFRLPVTNDTLGGLPAFGAGNNNRELRITLGSAPVVNPVGLYSPTVLTPGSPSGIDVNMPNIASVTDIYGNHALASAVAVDVDDGVGPSITSAVYTDIDNMGMGRGDTLVLTFTEPILISNVVDSDFTLPVLNDIFGSGPTFAVGPSSSQLTITLGTNPVLMVPGVFSQISTSAGSPSGINISTLLQPGHITDQAGNNAIPSIAAVDIKGPTGEVRPTLVSARWQDMNANGVDAGDRLDLRFDKPVIFRNYAGNDYNLPVTNDSLGANPNLSIAGENNRVLRILLGTSPVITVPGVYNAANHTAGSPSGIDVSVNMTTSGGLTDIYGNPAMPSSVKDITGSDTTGPVLLTAVYYDVDGNGVSQGDILGLEFDKSLQIQGTSFAAQFVLPVPGDSLGTNAQFSAGTTAADIRVKLGLSPVLTIAGIFTPPPPVKAAGEPSGIGCTGAAGAITDFSGNAPQGTTPVDIISASAAGPQLMVVRIDDVNNDLIVSAGDRMVLTFNKPVRIINPPGMNVSDFLIPVSGDSFGAGATFEVNAANSHEVLIGLQAGVKFRPDGTYSPSVISPGSPSGIGIRVGTTSLQDLIGNFVQGGNVVDIADTFAPFVTSARYEDVGNDGLNRGDRLYVRFSEQILTSNMSASDFSLTEALDTFGSPVTITQSETNEVIITVGNNPRFKIAGVYPVDAGSSGLDISMTFNAAHIKDVAGNPAKRSVSKDIYSNDTTAPTITAARYGDANNNGVIDGGDTLSVIFTKAIVINGVTKSDFNIINGTFGVGGLQQGSLTGTNEVTFVLGNAPTLVVEGVYPADPNASAIDLSAAFTAGRLTDIVGNNPTPTGFVDISDANGPVIVAATYFDVDANGVSQGDLLRLRFSRTIVVSGASATVFTLPVNGDSLGSSPTIGVSGSNEITITLGASPMITIAGTYMSGNNTMGSPSGININNFTTTITDASGNPARALPSAVDITGSDTVPPTLVSAVFEDLDGNGISVNDKITLTFSEIVIISRRVSLADFNIMNGNFGDNPKFAAGTNNRDLVITLGNNPVLSLFGPLQTAIGRSSATYVTGHIMDVSGNDWQAAVPALLGSKDIAPPLISAAKFVDSDGMGMGAGDRLEIYFNKAIIVNNAQPADFVLPVSGDSFGMGAAVTATSDPKVAVIILGNGVTFTVRGVFSPGRIVAGSASGINLARVLTSITSIAGIGAKPHSVAIDITSDDIMPPKFMSAETIGAHGKNIIKARGDSIELKAVLDDMSLRPSDITADLSAFGLGKAVAAQSYINNEAVWASFNTPDLRGTIEIVFKAIDIAGNVGTYSLFISVIMPVEKCIGELLPGHVLRKSGARDFKLLLKPSFRSFDTGMNKVVIELPKGSSLNDKTNFTNYDLSQSKVYVNGRLTTTRFNGTPRGGESVVTYESATGEITVLLGEKVNQNTAVQTVEINFRATVPEFEDEPFGRQFAVKVDDTQDPAAVAVTPGDVNGVKGDSDGLLIVTTGVKISYVTDKVVIAPSFWKVIFSVKFNADMNAEKPPRVTFRPTYTLQNEQNLTLMSFVDGLYMGYAVVPFEAFGFNGEYMINVYDAQDYMGNSVNTLTIRQKFSPKFLISAYVNPLDERSLVISAKYVQSATNEVLVANPTIRVWQDGTNENLLTNVVAMSRPNVYKGHYTVNPQYAGRAQIEVEGRVSPGNTVINGKSIAEFSSSFIQASAPSRMVSLDGKMTMNFKESSFERDVLMIMTPDFTNVSRYMASENEAAAPKMYAADKIGELKLINEVYQIYPEGLKSSKAVEIECDLQGADTKEMRHAGLFALNSKTGRWELISKDIKDFRLKTEVDKITSLAVFSDTVPPRLIVPVELDNKVISDKFDVELIDNGSGIDAQKIKAVLNGRLMRHEYEEKTSKLTLYLPERTVAGIHNVSVSAEDKLGNQIEAPNLQVQAAGFFDVINYVSYPNPAKNRLNINYTLGKNISDMSIRIYDSNAELVYAFDDLAPNYLSAGRHDSPVWNLLNADGNRVSNGIYFYKITAYDAGGGKVEKYGKIAVIK
jgi:hypothetical protein